MKTNKTKLGVGILSTCLTIFHPFKLMAQNETYSEVNSESRVKAEKSISTDDRISPIFFTTADSLLFGVNNILIPKKGLVLDLSYRHSEVNLEGKYSNINSSKISSKVSNDDTIAIVGLAATKNLFFNLSFSYGKQNSENDSSLGQGYSDTKANIEANGASDPYLSLGYRLDIDNISTVFNLGGTISTGTTNTQSDVAYTTNTTNYKDSTDRKLGGHVITPQISVFNGRSSTYLLGASLAYSVIGERASEESMTESNVNMAGLYSNNFFATQPMTITRKEEIRKTGGNIMNVSTFAELPFSKHRMGANISYISQADSERKNLTLNTTSTTPGLDLVVGSIYGSISFSKMFKLIPRVSYGHFTKVGEDLNLSEKSFLLGSINARFYF